MIFTEDQVDAAYRAAPESVKAYILEGELAEHLSEIVRREHLTRPQAEALMKFSRNLLLGLGSEASFAEALRTTNISAQAMGLIVPEVTQQIVPPNRRSPAFTAKPEAGTASPVSAIAAKPVPVPAPSSATPINPREQGSPREPVASVAQKPTYASDPYREPIE